MSLDQLALFESRHQPRVPHATAGAFLDELRAFTWNGKKTVEDAVSVNAGNHALTVPLLTNEFWTNRQRAANSLHEISYRACFKPQLPRFFIGRLTQDGERVYDPFSGRGTTALEAALLRRVPVACDINPLSRVLVEPRLFPPAIADIADRLRQVPWKDVGGIREDLLVFYHIDTLREISALRNYLLERERSGRLDGTDRWLRMVAVNRLTGHSPGFFSVYTLPPNQAVSVEAQAKINAERGQTPPRRDVPRLILAKSRSLLADVDDRLRAEVRSLHARAQLVTAHAASTPQLASESIGLVVTSPPFLDVVDYAADNWLRCWFCGIDPTSVAMTAVKQPAEWQEAMYQVFLELLRVLRSERFVAFEVGEVRGGRLRLEELVLPAAARAGFQACAVIVNSQRFTKTANCWGVSNNEKGTNSNRIVLLRKPA
jgi:hypothetical protein